MTHPPNSQPFDERSALAELEQLADKIQLSRRQREQTVAEFDDFVKKMREERYLTSIAATDRERREEDRAAAARAARPPAPTVDAGHPPVVATATVPVAGTSAASLRSSSSSSSSSVDVKETAPWPVPVEREAIAPAAGKPRAAFIGVGLAALAVVAVTVLLWRSSTTPGALESQPTGSAAAASAPSTPTQPVTLPPTAAPAAAAPVVPAGPPRALNIMMVTVRPVWARVTVDGRRALEREIPADQKIPFGADTTIAIRAGDAGAFRLIVDGKDLGVLGRDGQVFSRTFGGR